MKIVTYYSHLNGLEFLLVHKPELWHEIERVVEGVDASVCRIKESREVRSKGKLFYSPQAMNKAIRDGFAQHQWGERRISYWVTSDAKLIRKTLFMSPAEQKAEIEAAGLRPLSSYNQTDFVKERVAVEV